MLALYRAIWRHTWRRQLVLLLLSLVVAALAAAPLEFQQNIINHVVDGGDVRLLVWLAAGYLAVVALSSAFKFALNYQSSAVGENVIRRIRGLLYAHCVDQTVRRGTPTTSRGTLVTTLSAEAEAVGAFAGAAIATPVMQIGTLASVVGYITANQPLLGLIALGVLIPQVLIVLVKQPKINAGVRARTRDLRDAADRVAAGELRAQEKAVIDDFDRILATRLELFRLKLSSKFARNLVSGAGTAAILLVGGWLVLQGRTDAGTIVASISGLARLEGPWRDLISFYRQAATIRVSFELIVDQFVADDAAADRPSPVAAGTGSPT